MAFTKKKKKYHIETPAERAWIEEKLNVYKKWVKPYKGEIVCKRKNGIQECVFRSAYTTKEELLDDAKKTVEQLNALDAIKDWVLVNARLIGQAIDEDVV